MLKGFTSSKSGSATEKNKKEKNKTSQSNEADDDKSKLKKKDEKKDDSQSKGIEKKESKSKDKEELNNTDKKSMDSDNKKEHTNSEEKEQNQVIAEGTLRSSEAFHTSRSTSGSIDFNLDSMLRAGQVLQDNFDTYIPFQYPLLMKSLYDSSNIELSTILDHIDEDIVRTEATINKNLEFERELLKKSENIMAIAKEELKNTNGLYSDLGYLLKKERSIGLIVISIILFIYNLMIQIISKIFHFRQKEEDKSE